MTRQRLVFLAVSLWLVGTFIPGGSRAADNEALVGSSLVQIVAIVAPILGTLGVAWFNLRAGQKAVEDKVKVVETKATTIETAASALDKKVDGVKSDVAQVHEATNGLSHRLAQASGDAGFGRGQEKERLDERLRVAEAAGAVAVAVVPAPVPAQPDARTAMIERLEEMLRELRALPAPSQAEPRTPPAPRDTLRNAVAQIQEKTDQMTFTKPNVVDASEPEKP